MTPQTVSQLVQLFVTAPVMVRQSGQLKNRYFKIAVGVGGLAIGGLAMYKLLQAYQTADRKEEVIK